jgi:hypothetical protein
MHEKLIFAAKALYLRLKKIQMLKHLLFVSGSILLLACDPASTSKEQAIRKADSVAVDTTKTDTVHTNEPMKSPAVVNDSLNELAGIIAGMQETSLRFETVVKSADYQSYHKSFNERWTGFDSTRLAKLKDFQINELDKLTPNEGTLFYPFSGPDILYANTFFPKASQYVLIGLEPVGSLPDFQQADSLKGYFDKLNNSLNAILKFSFFRTVSMSSDLKNKQVDGTLHVLLLFLKRNGHSIAEVTPLTIDSTGKTQLLGTFKELKTGGYKTRGVEIKFITPQNEVKTMRYFSLNAADDGLKENPGFVSYLKQLNPCNTYLKGASYLMHKSYFSVIREIILEQSKAVIQDDSGIAIRYFSGNQRSWDYHFFGKYTRPIPMFSSCYQSDLDSLYKQQGSKDIGFGIGYNFRDKNSNFMVAVRK